MTSLQKIIPYGDDRYSIFGNGDVVNNKTGRILKPNINTTGYKQVKLYPKTGISNNFLVHRLVANAFIKNDLNLPFVNHIDNNILNNNISNLEWCTASHNTQHSYNTGRIPLSGSAHGVAKLDEAQVLIIRTLLKDLTIRDIASYFRVSKTTIRNIKNFKIWINEPIKVRRANRI